MKETDRKDITKGFLRAFLQDKECWDRDFIGEQTKELFEVFHEMRDEK